ncbi:hypothetical protein ANN_14900 [Periplaneta americana]|uniref:Irregular chiasm C-roughest protein n=1 Tax=Periplaneta americana TaxID=6978 RepID=A0ABQ8SYZ1_PERAM|nr:hypothetical protein ANN_14900 [Periplaneta americana]
MGNACYYSVEKLSSSSLLSKNLKIRVYKTVILPVVLYGCEIWTLTLRDEHRLRVFENKVLRKIFGTKRDEVTGEWRKLHNTELNALYSSPDIIRNIKSRRLRWAGHVARMGASRNAYRVLVGRPEGKRLLGRPRRRWEDNIKMDLRDVGYDNTEWIKLAQDRDQRRAYVRAAMNLRIGGTGKIRFRDKHAWVEIYLAKSGVDSKSPGMLTVQQAVQHHNALCAYRVLRPPPCQMGRARLLYGEIVVMGRIVVLVRAYTGSDVPLPSSKRAKSGEEPHQAMEQVLGLLLLLLLAAVDPLLGLEQRFAMEPQDQTAIVGSRVTLPCRVINKTGMLQWTKDDFGLGTHRNLSGFDRYSMIGSDEEDSHALLRAEVLLLQSKHTLAVILICYCEYTASICSYIDTRYWTSLVDSQRHGQLSSNHGQKDSIEDLCWSENSQRPTSDEVSLEQQNSSEASFAYENDYKLNIYSSNLRK